jgi:hypothetical protein
MPSEAVPRRRSAADNWLAAAHLPDRVAVTEGRRGLATRDSRFHAQRLQLILHGFIITAELVDTYLVSGSRLTQ